MFLGTFEEFLPGTWLCVATSPVGGAVVLVVLDVLTEVGAVEVEVVEEAVVLVVGPVVLLELVVDDPPGTVVVLVVEVDVEVVGTVVEVGTVVDVDDVVAGAPFTQTDSAF